MTDADRRALGLLAVLPRLATAALVAEASVRGPGFRAGLARHFPQTALALARAVGTLQPDLLQFDAVLLEVVEGVAPAMRALDPLRLDAERAALAALGASVYVGAAHGRA